MRGYMGDLKKEIVNAIELINATTELFYQDKKEQGYDKLGLTLSELIPVINQIIEYKGQNNSIDVNEAKLVELLSNAMNAMEKKDVILLSDILKYELIDTLDRVIISL